MKLPEGTGIVTRCPLQIDCVRSQPGKPTGVKIWVGLAEPMAFQCQSMDDDMVTQLIRKAQDEACGSNQFSSVAIHLKVVGPEQRRLQVVDLPGRAVATESKVSELLLQV